MTSSKKPLFSEIPQPLWCCLRGATAVLPGGLFWKRGSLIWSFVLFLMSSVLPSNAHLLDLRIKPYLRNGCVLVATKDRVLYQLQTQKTFLLASVLKIATTMATLEALGSSYQFKTEFYLNPQKEVVIKGYGDPLLTSEELSRMVGVVQQNPQWPTTLRRVFLDASAFSDITIPGVMGSDNPYDARNGALVANFNTVNLTISSGVVESAEAQTPLTPLAEQLSRGLSPGTYRLNVSQNPENTLEYAGQLIQAIFQQNQIALSSVLVGKVAPQDQLFYTYRNPTSLTTTLQSMLSYSTNFIANQVLLTSGMEVYGSPATLEKGVQVLQGFLERQMGLDSKSFSVVEGSGISHQNWMTPEALLQLMKAFAPYHQWLPQSKGLFVKTGTLQGVYNVVGYLPNPKDPSEFMYFIVLLNQKENHRDQILAELKKVFHYRLPQDPVSG